MSKQQNETNNSLLYHCLGWFVFFMLMNIKRCIASLLTKKKFHDLFNYIIQGEVQTVNHKKMSHTI